MDTHEIRAETDEYRAMVERTRREFAEFVEQFRADVAEKRDISRRAGEFAEARSRLEGAQLAVDEYVDQFRADLPTAGDAAEVAADADALRREFQTRQASTAEYVGEFGADAVETGDTTSAADAAAAFGEAVLARRERVEAFVEQFRADVAARRTRRDAWQQRVGEHAEEPAAETAAEPEPGDDEVTTAPDAGADEPADETTGAEDTQAETDTQEVVDTPSSEAESINEVSRTQEAAADGAFEEQLRDVPYGTLKKAANALGYDGDLNTATKDDLVDFFSERGMDELEAALEG